MEEYFGKHTMIDLNKIPKGRFDAYFHGELWVRCPHCRSGMEIEGATPVAKKSGYLIYRCGKCGELFKEAV